jgi:nicotinate-nucleotide adenylyltransferase
MLNKKENIAIFGASFNPIHIGHEAIIQYLLEKLHFDRVILVPVGFHAFDKALISPFHRYQFCRLTAKKFGKKVAVSLFEIKRRKKSFTYNTLHFMQKKYKTSNVFLVIGADNFINFSKWYKYDLILKKFPIVCFGRNDSSITSLNNSLQSITYIEDFEMNISSTLIRNDIENLIGFCSIKVQNYIKNKKLYNYGRYIQKI